MTEKKSGPKRYRCLVGLNYPNPKPGAKEYRAEEGEIVDNLPTSSIGTLLKTGAIEEAD